MPAKKKLRTEPAWEYNIDGEWKGYDAADSAMLEKEYVARKGGAANEAGGPIFDTTNFTFNQGYNTAYKVDFVNFTQTNQSSKTARPIRRLGGAGEVCWEYQDDNNLFVEFYEADTMVIENLYLQAGTSKPITTKDLSWNKGYNSLYTYTFTTETKDKNGIVVEVSGTQKNEDSSKVRPIKRTPKKMPWAVEGYGISGDKDVLAKLQQQLAAATAAQQQQQQQQAQVVAASISSTTTSTTTTTAAPPTPVAAAPTATSFTGSAPAFPPAATTTTTTTTSSATVVATGPSLGGLLRAPTMSLPHYWQQAKMFDAVGGHHEVPLATNTEEFKYIADKFNATIGKNVSIVRILRLENAALYSFYAMTRMMIATGEAQLAATGGKGSLESANEQFLFTGERLANNMLAIKKFGFDTRVAPADGAFGQGLYFGAKASFADNGRCIQNPDGTKDMLVCRVTVGNAAKGAKSIRRPPPLDPKKPTMALYDSCNDGLTPPETFVMFNNKQVYPEYIVRYQ